MLLSIVVLQNKGKGRMTYLYYYFMEHTLWNKLSQAIYNPDSLLWKQFSLPTPPPIIIPNTQGRAKLTSVGRKDKHQLVLKAICPEQMHVWESISLDFDSHVSSISIFPMLILIEEGWFQCRHRTLQEKNANLSSTEVSNMAQQTTC